MYFKTYYEEAIEALEEIGSILDYNTNARCKSGRRDLVDHVRHYKLNDGQYRRLYEQAQKDAEHFRGEANAYEAKWRAVLEKYENIRDTDWYTKIKDQEKQIDCQKDTIGRQLSEIKRLQEVNGSYMTKESAYNRVIDDANYKINELREKISRLEEENQRLQDVINRLKPVSDCAEVISLKIENNCLKSKINKLEKVLKGEM